MRDECIILMVTLFHGSDLTLMLPLVLCLSACSRLDATYRNVLLPQNCGLCKWALWSLNSLAYSSMSVCLSDQCCYMTICRQCMNFLINFSSVIASLSLSRSLFLRSVSLLRWLYLLWLALTLTKRSPMCCVCMCVCVRACTLDLCWYVYWNITSRLAKMPLH